VRSPESAPTSDVRDETLSSIISRSSSFDRVQLAWLRKLSGVMIVSRAETPILHAGTFLCVGYSLPPCGVCLLCGYRWFIL